MSEMVERVATAIEARVSQPGQCSYQDMARATFEAMREPTEAMIEAAWADALAEDAKGVWQEMIDEALKEKATA